MNDETAALLRGKGHFTILSPDGGRVKTYTYGSLRDVLMAIGVWRFYVDPEIEMVRVDRIRGEDDLPRDGRGLVRLNFFDAFGACLGADLISDAVRRLEEEYEAAKRKKEHPFKFRAGPVYRTGNWWGGRCHRRFSTSNEERAAVAVAHDEDAIAVGCGYRPGRSPASLPDSRDDFMRCDTRSWKGHRRTQWKS